MAKFKFKNTGQVFEYTEAKQVARLKKDPQWVLIKEEKTPRTRKPNVPKEITVE
jgi:hypothetical protein